MKEIWKVINWNKIAERLMIAKGGNVNNQVKSTPAMQERIMKQNLG